MTAKIGLVGAGYIAATHADALAKAPNLVLSAVIDPNPAAAQRLARSYQAQPFASLEAAIAAGAVDRLHILVPPHLHAVVGHQAIVAGLPSLMEKPLGATAAEARGLTDAARAAGVSLGVNQNFMFHPALEKLAAILSRGRIGPLRHVTLTYAAPLRQLAARQFGHWMFERPSNILLEQAVHPLSQLYRLIGPMRVEAAVASPALTLAPGMDFHKTVRAELIGATGVTAQLYACFGAEFPLFRLRALGDDGAVEIDMLRNQLALLDRTAWLDAGDTALIALREGARQAVQGVAGVGGYLGAQLKLVERQDPFFQSMKRSITAFHAALDAGRAPEPDAAMGADLVDTALAIAEAAGIKHTQAPLPPTLVPATATPRDCDVAVFGGTGFIGRALVQQLLDAGFTVSVAARGVRGLPAVFHDPRVQLVQADVTRAADIDRAIGGARFVVNLAHGGASGSREHILEVLAGSALAVAKAALARRVSLLVHVGSIAGLYLGDADLTITPQTPPDPQSTERGDYAHAKAEADRRLVAFARESGLALTIQRPGIVVGAGASPFHSGLGLFNNDQHCLGWNDGNNPLPFVLVEDTASAIVAAIRNPAAARGRTDNIVGDVRVGARAFIAQIANVTGRPIQFHPQALWWQQAVEHGKWAIKRAGGRAVPLPSMRDLRSRGMVARFDTSQTREVLGWQPCADPIAFMARAIET